MTISTTTLRTSATGAGAILAIPYSFATLASGDLLVIERVISTGVETELTEGASSNGYTATYSSTGGTVTTSDSIASTKEVHVIQEAPRTQTLDLVAGGAFDAENVEAMGDKIVRMVNENRDRINRLIRFPQSDPSASVAEMPNSIDRKGEYMFFDSSTGAPTSAAAVDTSDITVSTYMKTVLDDANANAAMATLNGRPVISVVNQGADNTGGATSQTAIQAALSAAEDGDIVWFPAGRYLFDAAFSDIVKDVSIGGDNAVLVASTRITAPVFQWDTRDDFSVSGLIYDGEETYSTYSASSGADTYGLIHLDTCDNVKVSNVSGLECRNVVKLTDSTNCIIKDIHHIGVLNVTKTNPNFHTTVSVSGGRNNRVENVYAEDGGACVTGGVDTVRCIISHCSGFNLFDNGAYISSGFDCVVVGCSFKSIVGGIKVRGSRHLVVGNSVEDTTGGISITGNGVVPDAFGANGFGSVCVGNIVYNSSSDGIRVFSQDGLFMRDVVISGNTITDSLGTGVLAAIRCSVERGLTISNNIINNNDSNSAIVVSGTGTTTAIIPQITITGNTLVDIAGEGMRLTDITDSMIANNSFVSTTGVGIELRNVTNSVFTNNSKPAGNILRDNAAFANTGNIYSHNYGNVAVDAAPAFLNRVIGNHIAATVPLKFTVDDATPLVEGGSIFMTNDDNALNITAFAGGDVGQSITIISGDAGNTTVKHDITKINLVGGADWVSNTGASLTLWYDGTDWNEISRAAPTVA